MTSLRLSAIGLSLCAVLASGAPASAAKAKKPSVKGLEQISGCAVTGTPSFCKLLGGFKLSDAKAFPGPVPTGKSVAVWGKRGGPITLCFAPAFDVVAWAPKPGKCPK